MIADSVIAWVHERFKKRKVNSKRPVYVVIYGPDGEIVKSVLVRNTTDELKTEQRKTANRGSNSNKGNALKDETTVSPL